VSACFFTGYCGGVILRLQLLQSCFGALVSGWWCMKEATGWNRLAGQKIPRGDVQVDAGQAIVICFFP
jgi:hypothetical protein